MRETPAYKLIGIPEKIGVAFPTGYATGPLPAAGQAVHYLHHAGVLLFSAIEGSSATAALAHPTATSAQVSVHGHEPVNNFIAAVGTGVMKLLIVDRGFIQGAFVTMVKPEAKSDVLFPLRKDMDMYQRAVLSVESAKWSGSRSSYRSYEKDGIRYTEDVASVKNVGLRDECKAPLYLSIIRTTGSTGVVAYWVLASTSKFKSAKEAIEHCGSNGSSLPEGTYSLEKQSWRCSETG